MTGTVTDTAGTPITGLQVCAVPEEDTGSGSRRLREDRGWCVHTDDTGRYTLRVNGGELLRWPELPTTQQYLDAMDPYLISERHIDDRVGGWEPAASPPAVAGAGMTVDLTLTSLVPGQPVAVSGVATGSGRNGLTPAVGARVCGFTRAGSVCTTAGTDGRYTLLLPTRVTPDNPTAEVRVRVVAANISHSDLPSVARFAAIPGSQHVVDLVPGLVS